MGGAGAKMSAEEAKTFLSSQNDWFTIFTELGITCTTDYLRNPENAERWLVICRGGNTRSVATAFLLKYKYGKDALAGSLEKNNRVTLLMLLGWADRVLVTEESHYAEVAATLTERVEFIDLTNAARLRAHPYEIPFLLEIDSKLKELPGEWKTLTNDK